jgi:hypothetical protein
MSENQLLFCEYLFDILHSLYVKCLKDLLDRFASLIQSYSVKVATSVVDYTIKNNLQIKLPIELV